MRNTYVLNSIQKAKKDIGGGRKVVLLIAVQSSHFAF